MYDICALAQRPAPPAAAVAAGAGGGGAWRASFHWCFMIASESVGPIYIIPRAPLGRRVSAQPRLLHPQGLGRSLCVRRLCVLGDDEVVVCRFVVGQVAGELWSVCSTSAGSVGYVTENGFKAGLMIRIPLP